MPSGEVFTGPHEHSAEGVVRFTIPTAPRGVVVEDVTLEFREGAVVGARAERGDALPAGRRSTTDPGARFLGELGIGTNFGIDRPIGAILFDEKIGGTVHLALGRSYPETGGTNESALHWDLICDLRQGGTLTADGEVILERRELPHLGAARALPRTGRRATIRAMRGLMVVLVLLVAGCGASAADPAPVATLRQVDDFPLYELTDRLPTPSVYAPRRCPARMGVHGVLRGGGDRPIVGRNFDFHDEPALLLRHHPPGAYSSISLVDISYLGFDRAHLDRLKDPKARQRCGAPRGCRSTA